jgi:hypothetical protein
VTVEYVYVELWNAKPAWLALDRADRAAFMEKIGAFLETIEKPGVCEVDSCCVNEGDTARRIPYSFVVIWKMTDKSHVKAIANGTARTGWYEYFDQVNAGGQALTADALIVDLIDH